MHPSGLSEERVVSFRSTRQRWTLWLGMGSPERSAATCHLPGHRQLVCVKPVKIPLSHCHHQTQLHMSDDIAHARAKQCLRGSLGETARSFASAARCEMWARHDNVSNWYWKNR